MNLCGISLESKGSQKKEGIASDTKTITTGSLSRRSLVICKDHLPGSFYRVGNPICLSIFEEISYDFSRDLAYDLPSRISRDISRNLSKSFTRICDGFISSVIQFRVLIDSSKSREIYSMPVPTCCWLSGRSITMASSYPSSLPR